MNYSQYKESEYIMKNLNDFKKALNKMIESKNFDSNFANQIITAILSKQLKQNEATELLNEFNAKRDEIQNARIAEVENENKQLAAKLTTNVKNDSLRAILKAKSATFTTIANVLQKQLNFAADKIDFDLKMNFYRLLHYIRISFSYTSSFYKNVSKEQLTYIEAVENDTMKLNSNTVKAFDFIVVRFVTIILSLIRKFNYKHELISLDENTLLIDIEKIDENETDITLRNESKKIDENDKENEVENEVESNVENEDTENNEESEVETDNSEETAKVENEVETADKQ